MIAALGVSGCGSPGVWLAGRYYGPPTAMNGPPPLVMQPEPPPTQNPAPLPPTGAPPPADQAYQYVVGNEKLDRSFQDLTSHMTLDQQLELSSEQTVWLNSRASLCGKNGIMEYACAIRLTNKRTAVLAGRVNSLPPYVPPTPPVPPAMPMPPPSAIVASKLVPAPAPPQVATVIPAPPPQIIVPPAPAVAPPPARLHATTARVAGTAMPWLWKPGELNSAYQFGIQDGTASTIVPLSRLNAQPGQNLTIQYVKGQIALGFQSPETDANGYSGQTAYGGNGVSGSPLPSNFMRPYPINLGALVGVFTNRQGSIVGAPFAIGDDKVTKQIPEGASQLQLGINDDIYGGANSATANSGSFAVQVSTGG